MPNLENLALNNINFSNNNDLGGIYQISSMGWIIASLVAQTFIILLKLSIDGNSYTDYSSFLSSAYSLGEILEKIVIIII